MKFFTLCLCLMVVIEKKVTEINAFQCNDITVNITNIVSLNELELSIIYNLKLSNASILFEDFSINCLKYLNLILAKSFSSLNIIYSRSINSSTGTVIFENLESFTNYTIKALYETKSGQIETIAQLYQVTCFGKPDAIDVSKVNQAYQPDQSLDITWKRPTNLNAPSLCYYEFIIYQNNKILSTNQTEIEFFKIQSGLLNNQLKFTIELINDPKCFNCGSKLGSGTKELQVLQKVSTSTITQQGGLNGSASYYHIKNSYFLIFLILILYNLF